MALIKCPECGRNISDKASCCPGCGCPASEFQKIEGAKETSKGSVSLDDLYESARGNKDLMIDKLQRVSGCDFETSSYLINKYLNDKSTEKNAKTVPTKEFSGIYKRTMLGEMLQIHCPKCGSENCSHYYEQKIKPGKTKASYSVNLNPLKPFTLINKKEKVVKKDKVVSEHKYVCNVCGKVFR